ncbi:angiopoietin-related protein 1-like [Branchiostoma floridae x Branchiostoma belcheri]
MKGVCQLAHKKTDVIGNSSCHPVGMPRKESQCGSEEGTNRELTNVPQGQRSALSREYYFDDCSEIYAAQVMFGSVSSGVYNIKPADSDSFSVYCDMTTDGGGWTVIQNRFDGTLHFNRRFNDYRYGFGSASGEYWVGLQNMYRITDQNSYELYVELVDWSDNVRYAKYSSFRVGAGSYYQLSLGSYSGNAGDSLGYSNGAKFSARDRDQDTHSSGNCATYGSLAGGWWYKYCGHSALNGPYLRPSDRTLNSGNGIYWHHISPSTYKHYLKKSKMMIRPTDFGTGK